jgi:hypothetical protein
LSRYLFYAQRYSKLVHEEQWQFQEHACLLHSCVLQLHQTDSNAQFLQSLNRDYCNLILTVTSKQSTLQLRGMLLDSKQPFHFSLVARGAPLSVSDDSCFDISASAPGRSVIATLFIARLIHVSGNRLQSLAKIFCHVGIEAAEGCSWTSDHESKVSLGAGAEECVVSFKVTFKFDTRESAGAERCESESTTTVSASRQLLASEAGSSERVSASTLSSLPSCIHMNCFTVANHRVTVSSRTQTSVLVAVQYGQSLLFFS